MKQPAIAAERKIVINYINRFICFDNLEHGTCDHAACYALKNLVHDLVAGKHLGYNLEED